MNSSKISIIVPVYKVEQYLRRCLDSIVAQTFADWECILIDDGSPDNSGKICDEYAEKDNRFRVFHQGNAGVSAARNKGLDEARGEWITFVDSDDWVEREMLEDLHKYAKDNCAEVVICGFSNTDGKQKRKSIIPKTGSLNMPKDFEWYFNAPWGKIFKKDIIDKYNIKFPLGITLAEDLWFVFQILYSATNVYGINEILYNYYYNSDSVTKSLSEKNFKDEICIIKMIEKQISQNNNNSEWNKWLNIKKLSAKNNYLYKCNPPNFNSWRNTFDNVPNKSCTISLHNRLFYKLISIKMDLICRLIIKIKKFQNKCSVQIN